MTTTDEAAAAAAQPGPVAAPTGATEETGTTAHPGSTPASHDAARRTALGRYGEDVAARHLVHEQGMVLLDRNWRCPAGEIDLVLRDGDDLVVAEVKTRSSDACGTPHEAVSPAKLGRLRKLAAAWLAAHHAHPRGVRIDLVAVLRPPRGAAVVEHVRGLG